MKIAGWDVDPDANTISAEGAEIKLSPLAMHVLVYLAENAGDVVTSDELLANCWRNRNASESALYKVISELRRSIADRLAPSVSIKTVSKRGYCLNADVQRVSRAQHIDQYQSEPGIEASMRSGRQAIADLNYDLAIRHFKVAIRQLESAEVQDLVLEGECYFAIAECLLLEQGMEAAAPYNEKAASIAEQTQNPTLLARSILVESGGLQPIYDGRLEDLRAELKSALATVPRSEQAVINRLTSRILSFTRPVTDSLLKRAEENLNRARELDDVNTLCHALVTLHEMMMHPKYLRERQSISAELLSICHQSTDSDIVTSGYLRSIDDAMEVGDLTTTRKLMSAMQTLRPQYLYQDDLQRLQSMFYLFDGDFESAESAALSINVREAGPRMLQMLQLIVIRRLQHQLEELVPLLELVAEENPAVPAVTVHLALCYADAGQRDAAIAELERLGDINDIPRDVSWPCLFVALIETCVMIEDRELAARLLQELDGYEGTHLIQSAACYFGAGDFFLGLLHQVLGNLDEAKKFLQQALIAHQAMSCKPLVARTQALLEEIG